jgi:GR25 family glycosyltransferase involved in LPS biosynthesis
MDPIPLVIISSPKEDRSAPLLNSLHASSIFEVIKLDATMGIDLGAPESLITTQELIRFGRILTQNERACAISHTRARAVIKNSNFGGVIMEDDARILDIELFQKTVCEFLESNALQKKILSLL